jgi:uncharacterized repeat protein (TIGR01451 family)
LSDGDGGAYNGKNERGGLAMTAKVKLTVALGLFVLGTALAAAAQQNRGASSRGEQPAVRQASTEPVRRSPRSASSGQQVNHVSIEIVGPPSASFGEPADFELIVQNQGTNQVENVRVEAELPETSEFVSAVPTADVEEGTATWLLDRLAAGQERRIKLQLKPIEEGTLECHAMVTCMVLSGTQTTVTRPQLQIAMTGPREVAVGQVAVFTLRVSNPGSGDATNVLIRDIVPPGFVHPAGEEIEYEVGTLAPGDSRELKLELTAKGAGVQKNYAQVIGDGGLRQSAEFPVRVLEPQLAISKTGPKRRYLERPATYSIEVRNPGTAAASRVSVVDEVPDGFQFVEASESGKISPDKRSVRWALDQLDPGESYTLNVTVRPTLVGEFISQAVATADGGLRAETQTSTIVEGVCNLYLEVIGTNGTIEVGSETMYEVRVINRGSQAATNLVIQAAAPAGMTPLKADGPVQYEISGREIIFEPIARLAPRADAGFQIYVRGDRAGDMRFSVELHCDQLDRSLKKEESTRVYADQ